MLEYIFCSFLVLSFCYWFLKYFVENGFYIPMSRRYGMRRYVFPKDEATVRKLNSECRYVCREVINGDILKYPFLEENATSLAFSKRIITVFYERGDPRQTPVAFHAPFVFEWETQRGFHCGLMMVVPKHQKQGLQNLTVWSVFLYLIFRGIDIITDITGFAGGASYLTIQDKTQSDAYPVWRQPEVPPKEWHLQLTRYMLAHNRSEFGCSKNATLDDNTLVVSDSFGKDGDGAWQLLQAFDIHNQRSSSIAKQQFIATRLNNNEESEQFFIGRADLIKMLSVKLRLRS